MHICVNMCHVYVYIYMYTHIIDMYTHIYIMVSSIPIIDLVLKACLKSEI